MNKKFFSIFLILLLALFLFGCLGTSTPNNDNNSINDLNSDVNGNKVVNNLDQFRKVKSGDMIAVNYVGRLEDGNVFDTSIESVAKESGNYNSARDYAPLEFTVGAGQMIKGFDAGVIGMKIGETKMLTLPPEQAYGVSNPAYIKDFNKTDFPPLISVGLELPFTVNGNTVMGTIIEINDQNVVVDFNPKLAGKTLVFEVTLVEFKN